MRLKRIFQVLYQNNTKMFLITIQILQRTIFEFKDDVRFVFKITDNINSINRYDNYLFSKYICDYFNLNLLKIPKTILVIIKHNGNNKKFTIEEKMNIKNIKGTCEEFHENADAVNDTVYFSNRGLLLYICKYK